MIPGLPNRREVHVSSDLERAELAADLRDARRCTFELRCRWAEEIHAREREALHDEASTHVTTTMHAERDTHAGIRRVERVGTPMTTIQAVVFGVMLALMPSMILLAFLLCREGTGSQADLKFDDQPPHANTQ